MKPTHFSAAFAAALLSAIAMLPVDAKAQTANAKQPTPLAASAPTAVTPLIPFAGTVLDGAGKPRTGSAAITFLIFQDEQGGEPLFTESQLVTPDAMGHYSVQLGASLPNGLPVELFANGAARWLEVQVEGETPGARTLLTSVPYSLKAGDAATLGGLSADSFVTQAQLAATSKAFSAQPAPLAATANTTTTTSPTGSGTANYVPLWTGSETLADSAIFQSGKNVGIGTTTPTAPLEIIGPEANAASVVIQGGGGYGALKMGADVNANTLTPSVRKLARVTMPDWAADSLGVMLFSGDITGANNNDVYFGGTPSGTQYAATGIHFVTAANGTTTGGTEHMTVTNSGSVGIGTTTPAAQLEVNGTTKFDGLVSFASGQTFPGGSGTISGVTAGTALTGGGTTGAVTLNVDTTKVPLLGANVNTFTGSQTIGGNLGVTGNEVLGGNVTTGSTITAGQLVATGGLTTPQLQSTTGTFSGTVKTAGMLIPSNGGSSPYAGAYSFPLDMQASSYDFQAGGITKTFRWQVEPVNNDTGLTSATLNLLSASNSATPTETGLNVDPSGNLTASSVTSSTVNATTLNSSAINLNVGEGVETAPYMVIQGDDNGIARQAAQQLVIQGATIPGQQLLMGYITDADTNSNGGLATIQATWKGVVNTVLSLQPNGGCVCVRTGGNAIAFANDPFVVGQGQGAALADGWYTYSSRRFKTDIQTLPDALQKIEKMRGVSYTLKATGKREIGVIAEEVGAVVPEAVTWEANGKDARGVDYNRLTAVLIEATKEQQKEIERQGKELSEERVQMTAALHAIQAQQRQIRMQTASIAALKAQQRGTETLSKVNQNLGSTQFHAHAALLVGSR